MSKIYGAQVKMVYDGQIKIRRNWYSADETKARLSMEKAQEISPPANTVVEFEPISADVTVLTAGIYRTDKNKLVHIYTAHRDGIIHAHGRFLKANRKPMMAETCTFYTNGQSCTHPQWGDIVDLVDTE